MKNNFVCAFPSLISLSLSCAQFMFESIYSNPTESLNEGKIVLCSELSSSLSFSFLEHMMKRRYAASFNRRTAYTHFMFLIAALYISSTAAKRNHSACEVSSRAKERFTLTLFIHWAVRRRAKMFGRNRDSHWVFTAVPLRENPSEKELARLASWLGAAQKARNEWLNGRLLISFWFASEHTQTAPSRYPWMSPRSLSDRAWEEKGVVSLLSFLLCTRDEARKY